jgi:hypothetical protein
MDNQIVMKIEDTYDPDETHSVSVLPSLNPSEEVLVDVRGRPASRGGHVVLASTSHHNQQNSRFKISESK